MIKLINFILFFILINIFVVKGFSQHQIIHEDSIYSLSVEKHQYDSLIFNEYLYIFYIDSFELKIRYHQNTKLSSVLGYYIGKKIGVMFSTNSNGLIKRVKFLLFDIEAGPEIEFYDNYLVKSYYNYGFQKSDLDLQIKEGRIYDKKDIGMISYSPYFYYKEKNGSEYYYNKDGKIIKIIIYSNGKIIETKEY